MYARSTTFNGNPAALDAGIVFIRDEVMPQIMAMQGCTGLSMMADRDSGRCIATSGWTTFEAMGAANDALRPIRARGGDILGAAPMVEEWEVAVMHREHPTADGACARATWLQMDPVTMQHHVDIFRMASLPRLDEIDGFCSASLLVSRERGRCVITTTYADRQMLEASRAMSETIRTAALAETGAEVIEIAEMDMMLAHLHVPETV